MLHTRKLLINDDHMIWNYRKRLEEIAVACELLAALFGHLELDRPSSLPLPTRRAAV
jgi:hypothetical protein